MGNMVVNTNVLALNAHRNMKGVGALQETASKRLASGFKINSAADDAAGLAISEKMRSQIRGLDMASKNSQDAISLIQTAEGGLTEVDNMLQRMRELTVQAANDTNTTAEVESAGSGLSGASGDRDKLVQEMNQLVNEILVTKDRIKYNNRTLLDGTMKDGLTFQTGSNKGTTLDGNLMEVKVDIDLETVATSLGTVTDGTASVGVNKSSSAADFNSFIGKVDKVLTSVVDARAKLGAYQNRLEYTIKSLDNSSENLSAAESRIRDTDMAKEMMTMTKANILQQSTISILSQANQNPQSVLKLLG